MSEPKFTAGPWFLVFGNLYGHPILGVSSKTSDKISREPVPIICAVSELEKINDGDLRNAFLIAAAPDMYEALVRLLEVIDCNATGSYGDAEDNAREILKKARGEK